MFVWIFQGRFTGSWYFDRIHLISIPTVANSCLGETFGALMWLGGGSGATQGVTWTSEVSTHTMEGCCVKEAEN